MLIYRVPPGAKDTVANGYTSKNWILLKEKRKKVTKHPIITFRPRPRRLIAERRTSWAEKCSKSRSCLMQVLFGCYSSGRRTKTFHDSAGVTLIAQESVQTKKQRRRSWGGKEAVTAFDSGTHKLELFLIRVLSWECRRCTASQPACPTLVLSFCSFLQQKQILLVFLPLPQYLQMIVCTAQQETLDKIRLQIQCMFKILNG